MEKGKYIIVYVTAGSDDAAGKIAAAVVEEHLAACASIVNPIRSVYWWDGKVQDETEALIIIKTRSDMFEALKKRILELHPYQVPEIVAVPIEAGHDDYLKWIDESVGAHCG